MGRRKMPERKGGRIVTKTREREKERKLDVGETNMTDFV